MYGVWQARAERATRRFPPQPATKDPDVNAGPPWRTDIGSKTWLNEHMDLTNCSQLKCDGIDLLWRSWERLQACRPHRKWHQSKCLQGNALYCIYIVLFYVIEICFIYIFRCNFFKYYSIKIVNIIFILYACMCVYIMYKLFIIFEKK